jgi:hypothetical protein
MKKEVVKPNTVDNKKKQVLGYERQTIFVCE